MFSYNKKAFRVFHLFTFIRSYDLLFAKGRNITQVLSLFHFPGLLPPGAPWPLSALEWRSCGLGCCSLHIFPWPVLHLPSSSWLAWFPSSSWLTFVNRWSTASSNFPRRDTEKIIFDSATICKCLYLAYSDGNGLVVFWFQFPCIGPLSFCLEVARIL